MLGKLRFFLAFVVLFMIVVNDPNVTSEPGPNPKDPARENLARVEYPSQNNVPWHPHFIRPHQNLESLFGEDWHVVARFNRIDRRHVYPGMTIKVPDDIVAARDYSPLPAEYPEAKKHKKYLLLDLGEQWMGAYEFGKLRFSAPAATGSKGYETPVGLYRIDARDRRHTSSLYRTEDDSGQYPMDNAMRFHFDENSVSYWIHARDLPGKPASHGCVGLFDEAMQNRVYGVPERPVLLDSQKFYQWAVGEGDTGRLELLTGGPVFEIRGTNPIYRK